MPDDDSHWRHTYDLTTVPWYKILRFLLRLIFTAWRSCSKKLIDFPKYRYPPNSINTSFSKTRLFTYSHITSQTNNNKDSELASTSTVICDIKQLSNTCQFIPDVWFAFHPYTLHFFLDLFGYNFLPQEVKRKEDKDALANGSSTYDHCWCFHRSWCLTSSSW